MVFFKSIKKVSILISLMYIVSGYFLLVQKAKANELVFNVLAIGLGAAGLFSIVRYFLLKLNERYKRNDFALGVIILMAGVMLYFVKYQLFTSIALIVGLLMIVSGLFCVQDAFDGKAIGLSSSGVYVFLLVVEIIFGALVIINPFEELEALYIVMAIGLLICGVGSILSNFFLAIYRYSYENKIKKQEEQEKLEQQFNIKYEEVKPETPLREFFEDPELKEVPQEVKEEVKEETKEDEINWVMAFR